MKLHLNCPKIRQILKNFKYHCKNTINICTEIFKILESLKSIIEETISSFDRIPSRNILLLYEDNIQSSLDYSLNYDKWLRIVRKNLLELQPICEIVKYHKDELISILSIARETFLNKFKDFSFYNIEYEEKTICLLQNYSQQLKNTSIFCKNFAIIASARYRDLKNNTIDHNLNNYMLITSKLTKIKSQLKNDVTYITLEKNYNELNESLSYWWKKYIFAIKEQNKLQFIIKWCSKSIEKGNIDNYKTKGLVFTIVLRQNIVKSIDNILKNMSILYLKDLSNITRKYDKKSSKYTKINKDYENFIRIMFS